MLRELVQTVSALGTHAARLVVLAALLTTSACKKKPEVQLTVSPNYPCKGEDVTFHFSTKRVDHIRVEDNDGNILLNTSNSSGSFVINDISQSKLPIAATGTRKGKSATKHIPPDYRPFEIVENATQIEAETLKDKIEDHREEVSVGTEGCNCEWSSNGTTCQSYPEVVMAYAYYKGKRSEFLQSKFSPRARVVGIRNDSEFHLTFFRNDIAVGELGPGEARLYDYTDDIRPWGSWQANFQELWEVYLGAYIKSKQCGGWKDVGLPATRDIPLTMTLGCNL